MNNNTLDRVRKCVAEQANRSWLEVELSDDLEKDWKFDSLDYAELGMMIEEEFDIDLKNGLQECKTVEDIVGLVS